AIVDAIMANYGYDNERNRTGYKTRQGARLAAEMLALFRTLRPGDNICFRHKYRNGYGRIVALGEVSGPYQFDDSHIELFAGWDFFHRIPVDWTTWFDLDTGPSFPKSVWTSHFKGAGVGRTLFEVSKHEWQDIIDA